MVSLQHLGYLTSMCLIDLQASDSSEMTLNSSASVHQSRWSGSYYVGVYSLTMSLPDVTKTSSALSLNLSFHQYSEPHYRMKRNPRKVRWTKAFRKAAGKEMTIVSSYIDDSTFVLYVFQDSTIDFEKRRNVPVRYDRDLVQTTVSAMKRIAEIKSKRENAFWKHRYGLPFYVQLEQMLNGPQQDGGKQREASGTSQEETRENLCQTCGAYGCRCTRGREDTGKDQGIYQEPERTYTWGRTVNGYGYRLRSSFHTVYTCTPWLHTVAVEQCQWFMKLQLHSPVLV